MHIFKYNVDLRYDTLGKNKRKRENLCSISSILTTILPIYVEETKRKCLTSSYKLLGLAQIHTHSGTRIHTPAYAHANTHTHLLILGKTHPYIAQYTQ